MKIFGSKKLKRRKKCPLCEGTGFLPSSTDGLLPGRRKSTPRNCTHCGGLGHVKK
jgi:DnaJ-class molecular chaperone